MPMLKWKGKKPVTLSLSKGFMQINKQGLDGLSLTTFWFNCLDKLYCRSGRTKACHPELVEGHYADERAGFGRAQPDNRFRPLSPKGVPL